MILKPISGLLRYLQSSLPQQSLTFITAFLILHFNSLCVCRVFYHFSHSTHKTSLKQKSVLEMANNARQQSYMATVELPHSLNIFECANFFVWKIRLNSSIITFLVRLVGEIKVREHFWNEKQMKNRRNGSFFIVISE